MIGVKHMKMPNSCEVCRFKCNDYEGRPICSLIKNTKKSRSNNSLSYWKYTGIDAYKRPDNCPLVEIVKGE